MSNEIHDEIIMGSLGNVYGGGDVQCITFCVTEECNLRCRYCYMVHKNSFRRMTFEVAKRAIDYLLEYPFESDCVQWDFIGGEPTLEMELIDKISDYIKIRMFETNHKWFDHYIFSVGTNGILYDSELVQRYISKNRYHVSFGITIDGTKLKHDLQRVFPNGQGSYELVEKNVALWKKQFPNASTKVTFASEDLCMLKESIVHLWNLGLNVIPANIVYEDVWKPGDAEIYEQQLIELADYIIENRLWADHSVRFFDPNIGLPLSKCQKEHNYCGTGKMIAIDCTGDFFPCIRFLDFCMPDEETPRLKSGDIHNGINRDIVAAFENLSLNVVNDGECADCPIASGCFTCTGNSYAYTYPHTIYSRTKFQCEMQKAQVRANNYFWKQLGQLLDYPTPREVAKKILMKMRTGILMGLNTFTLLFRIILLRIVCIRHTVMQLCLKRCLNKRCCLLLKIICSQFLLEIQKNIFRIILIAFSMYELMLEIVKIKWIWKDIFRYIKLMIRVSN